MSSSFNLNPSQESQLESLWVCQLEKKDSPWTVGEKRELNCQGEEIKNFKTLPRIFFSKENSSLEYSLHILEMKPSDQTHLKKASFVVTSYKPGDHTASFFISSENVKVKVLNPLSWKVENTLKTQMGSVKPHGPMGPFLLSWPMGFKILGIVAVFFICCFFVFKLYRFFLKKYWKKKALQFLTTLSPYHELNREIRQLLKKYPISLKTDELKVKSQKALNGNTEFDVRRNYIKDLEKSFQMYLTKTFFIPADRLKTRSLIKEIKWRKKNQSPKKGNQNFEFKDFKDLKKELRFLMDEFKQAKQEESQLKVTDCEHLTQWVRKWSEGMDRC